MCVHTKVNLPSPTALHPHLWRLCLSDPGPCQFNEAGWATSLHVPPSSASLALLVQVGVDLDFFLNKPTLFRVIKCFYPPSVPQHWVGSG